MKKGPSPTPPPPKTFIRVSMCYGGLSTLRRESKGGTVAVSTNGLLRNKLDREYFKQGLAVMIETLRPQTVVNYSQMPDDIFGPYKDSGLEFMGIPHYAFSVRKEAA